MSQIKGCGTAELKRFIAENPDWLIVDHSQLEQWEVCHRRFKYQYIDRLARITSYDAEFGNVLHALMSEWYKAAGNWTPSELFMRQAWEDFTERVWNAPSPRADRANIFTRDHAIRCFTEYARRYRPDFEAYEVESSEQVYFREIMPGALWLSKPDLVLRRKGDRQRVTNDFKHSVWDFNQNLLEFDRQFIGQAYAAESKWMIKSFFHSQVAAARRSTARRDPALLVLSDDTPGGTAVAIHRSIEPVDGELIDEWIEETQAAIEPMLKARQTGVYQKRAPRACMDFNRLCEFSELCVLGKKAGQIMIDTREKVNPNEYLGL